jgi:hypothetical protein
VGHRGLGKCRERRDVCRVLVGKPEGNSPLGRHRPRWKDLQEVEWERGGMDWIDLAQDMVRWLEIVNVVMNLRVP